MKLTAKLAVLATAILGTIAVAGAPASATTCYVGGGNSYTWQISRCGSSIDVIYHGPTVVGHFELYNYSTHQYLNGPNGTYSAGEYWDRNVAWNARTCVELWIPNGSGGWTREGSIVCTPA